MKSRYKFGNRILSLILCLAMICPNIGALNFVSSETSPDVYAAGSGTYTNKSGSWTDYGTATMSGSSGKLTGISSSVSSGFAASNTVQITTGGTSLSGGQCWKYGPHYNDDCAGAGYPSGAAYYVATGTAASTLSTIDGKKYYTMTWDVDAIEQARLSSQPTSVSTLESHAPRWGWGNEQTGTASLSYSYTVYHVPAAAGAAEGYYVSGSATVTCTAGSKSVTGSGSDSGNKYTISEWTHLPSSVKSGPVAAAINGAIADAKKTVTDSSNDNYTGTKGWKINSIEGLYVSASDVPVGDGAGSGSGTKNGSCKYQRYSTSDHQIFHWATSAKRPATISLSVEKSLVDNSLPDELKDSPLYKVDSNKSSLKFAVYDKNWNAIKTGLKDGETLDLEPDDYAGETVYIRETSRPNVYGDISSASKKSGDGTVTTTPVTHDGKKYVKVVLGEAGSSTVVGIKNPALDVDPAWVLQKVYYNGTGSDKLNLNGIQFRMRYIDQYTNSKDAAKIASYIMATDGNGNRSSDYFNNDGTSKLNDNTVGAKSVFPGTLTKQNKILNDRFTNYGNSTYSYVNTNSWIYETGTTGECAAKLTSKDTQHGGMVSGTPYKDGDGVTFWPVGTYVISEINGTNAAYLNPADVIVVNTYLDSSGVGHRDYYSYRYNPSKSDLPVIGDDPNTVTDGKVTIGTTSDDVIYNDDVPTLGQFTMGKTLEDITNIDDKDTADENGNDAGIDVDERNNEVIVQGNLYLKKLSYGSLFMYYPNGISNPAGSFSKDMSNQTMPYLLFQTEGEARNSGSKANGNQIVNGKIQMVRRTDTIDNKKVVIYEFRTEDMAISPGDYLFVETDVATGLRNNYPGPATNEAKCFPIHVDASKRSYYIDAFDVTGKTAAEDHSVNNGVKKGGVIVSKVDKEWDSYKPGVNQMADQMPQGDGRLYAEFAIYNMNNDAAIIAETSDNNFTDKVPSKQIVGFMYTNERGEATQIYRLQGKNGQNPSNDNRPATYNATTGEWTLKSNAKLVTLPWGNYAIQETTQPLGYVSVDTEFNRKYGPTVGGDPYAYSHSTDSSYIDENDPTAIKVRDDHYVTEFTYDTGSKGSKSSYGDYTILVGQDRAVDQIIRGGIYVEKTDYDALVDVYTPEGNGEFSDLGFVLTNKSDWPVWVDLNGDKTVQDSEVFQKNQPIVNSDNKYNTQKTKDYTFTVTYNADKQRYCFESPVDFLPYGRYEIKEQTDETTPKSGYHMLGSKSDGGVRDFSIRENAKIEDGNKFAFTEEESDRSFANPVKRAGIVVEKRDKDGNTLSPEGDATLAGAHIAIWNTSEHSVVTDQNGDGQLSGDISAKTGERYDRVDAYTEEQINQAIANGLHSRKNEKTGSLEWYGSDDAGHEVRTCVVIYTDDQGVAQTSSIALPYGDYIVREVQAPEGYHVDTNFRLHVTVTDDVETPEADNDGEVRIPPDGWATVTWTDKRSTMTCVREGKLSDLRPLGAKYERNLTEHYDETLNAFTTESRTNIYDRVIRGSFIVQKVDEDDWAAYNNNTNNYTNFYINDDGKYVIEQQGDASFEGAEFDVVNISKHDIITYTYNATGDLVKNTYAPNQVVWHFKLDGNGYYESPDDLLPYGTYRIVETKPSEGYKITNLTEIDFRIGRTEEGTVDIIDINDELLQNTTENDLIFSLEGYNIKHIQGAKYRITSASTGNAIANKSFSIHNAMEDDIYIFDNGTDKVEKVRKIAPDANVYALNGEDVQVTTDKDGVCTIKQLTAHLGGTDYRDGTKYTLKGDITGTLEIKLDDYTQRFIANLTKNTEYDKYPITEPVVRGGLNVRKVDEDEWDNADRSDKAQGDADFSGAVFSIYNISDRYVWVEDEEHNWRRTWPLSEDGTWQGQQNVEADKVYDPDESIKRIGKTKVNTILHTGMTTEGNKVTSYEGTYVDLVPAFNGAVTEEVIEKYHQEDKERIFENDMLNLVKNNTAVLKITTNKAGIATTGANDLPYGTYLVVETESSEGYMLPRNWYRIVEIRKDGHLYTWEETNTEYTVNVDTKVTKEPVIRGDVQIMKYDAELNAPHSLSKQGLEGIQYKIYNVSKSYTYLWELTNYRNESLLDSLGLRGQNLDTPIKIVNSETFNPATSEWWRNLDKDSNNYVTTITTHWNPTHEWTDEDGEKHVGAYTAETYVRNEDGSKKLWADDEYGAIRGALPYGTYLIRESATNEMYNFDDGDAWIFQIREECETVELGWHAGDTEGTAKHVMHTDNHIERQDIWFNKIGDGDSVRMDTMWVIKNNDTGERHVIVTNSGSDADNTGNGTYESGADVTPHTYDTNANDLFLQYIDDNDLLNTNVDTISEVDAERDGNPDNKPIAITMGSDSDFYNISRETVPGQKDDVVTKTIKPEYEGLTIDNDGLGLAHYNAGTWFGWCEFAAYDKDGSVSDLVKDGKAQVEIIGKDEITGETLMMHWAEPDDSLKAFPNGHYTISEVRTNTNIGYGLQSYDFEIDNKNLDLSKWYTENVVRDREVDLGTITDDLQPELEVSTLLTDVMTESHVSDAKSNKVILNEDVEYTVIGDASAMVKKDYRLEAALYEAVQDEEGKWTTTGDAIATAVDDDFRIKGNYGKSSVKYEFDATQFDLEGKTLVSCVYIYEMDGENKILVGKAEDAGDEYEQVVMPKITTEFTSLSTGGHVVPVGKDVTVTDTIKATNLHKDTKYAVSAKLMYMDEDGNAVPVLNEDGEPIETGIMPYKFISETEAEFAATFKHVDTTKYEGDKLVAYAYLYVNDETVARHEDIADEAETIYVPEIHTDAIDGVSGDQQGVVAVTDKVEDVITFKNLEVGTTYYAVGELYEVDAEGNTVPVMIKSEDGTTTPVRGFTQFVPTNEDENVKVTDGQVKVTFDIDSTEYAGKNIVVYETVYGGTLTVGEDEEVTIEKIINDLTPIANHTEPTDERQTIHYPEITTNANDANTGTKSALAIKETEVVDTISFKNLIVDAKYTFDGTLMTKDEEGNAVPVLDANGDEIHGRLVTYNEDGTRTLSKDNTYVPKTADGSVDMLFVFDATDYAGKDVTVFEKLLSGVTGVEYTQHEDIEDGNQTVHFPEIGTQAKDPTTGDEIGYATDNTTITDTVMYKNLVPGLTYKVVGVLYDKETGKPIKRSEAKTDDATETDATETDTTESTETDTSDDTELNSGSREFIVGKDIEAGYYKIEGGEVESVVNGGKYGYWCIYVSKDGKTVPTERTIDTTLTNGIVTGKSGHEFDYIRVADNMVLKLDEHAVYTKVTEDEAKDKLNTTVARYFEDMEKADLSAGTVSDKNDLAPTNDTIDQNGPVDNTPDVTDSDVNLDPTQPINHDDTDVQDTDTTDGTDTTDTNVTDTTNPTDDSDTATNTDATDTDADKTPIVESDDADHITGKSYVNNDNVDDTLVTAYTYFVCANADGTVDVALTFDATGFKGRDVVVFEKLYLVTTDEEVEEITEETPNRKEIELAQHEDINDLGQTIIYPDVHTEALDRDTKLHESRAKEETVIVDKVFCSNLIKDKEYTISGYLVSKETGSIISDAKGNAVKAELTFTAEADGDCVKELEFKFDASTLKGQTLVAYETLLHNNVPVAVHADINDEAQTVYFPDIKTVATALASGAKLLDPIEAEKINDEIKYENLVIGHKYRIEGKLVNVETGEVIKGTDDKELSGSIEFTATAANGSVFVEFGNVNAQTYKGKEIVVIESLYNIDGEKPELLVEHNELDDKEQTVKVTNPAVNTVLAETDTENKAIAANETVKLTDKISYTDLIPGNEYVVVSTLVDAATGKTLQDDNKKDITVESTIKPEKATAVIDAKFSFKGTTVKGKVVVAYNDLYRVIDGERYLVVSEHDLKNANQTVTFPEIGTTATDADNKTHTLTYDTKAVINDEVKYTGLEAGKEYTLTATPYDKATGKALEGVEPVTIKFTPGNPTGTVNIQVVVDSTKLAGKKIVMFESVKYEGKEIAVHNDINDEAQTVTVCKIGTTLTGADKKSKTVDIGEKVVLVDTVKFEGLTPGATYVLTGEIIDKNTYTGTTVTANEKTDKAKAAESTTEKSTEATKTTDTNAKATDKTTDVTEATYPEGRKQVTEFMKGLTITLPDTLGGNQTAKDRMKVTSYALTEYSTTPDVNSDYKLDVTYELTAYGSKTDTFKGNASWESTVECMDKDGKVIATSVLNANIEKGVGTTATGEVKVPVNTAKVVFYEKPLKSTDTTADATTEKTTEATTESKKTETATTTDKKTSSTSDYSKSVIATNSIEFTPTTADGTVEISFTIDTTNLKGHNLVAFESVSDKSTSKTIAVHKDINDEDQTVTVKTKPNVQTGVQRLAIIFAILALLGLAGFAYYTRKQFKLVPVKKDNDDIEE